MTERRLVKITDKNGNSCMKYVSSEMFQQLKADKELLQKFLQIPGTETGPQIEASGAECSTSSQRSETPTDQYEHDESESESTCSSPGETSAQLWKKEPTLLLISEYKEYQDCIDKGKIKKKVVWTEIAKHLSEEGYNFTPDQVCSRWKTLMRSYKAVKDSNKRSGSGHKTYVYESHLDDVFCDNPVIQPVEVMSSTHSNTSDEQSASCSSEEHPVDGPKKKRARLSSASQVVGIMKDYMEMQERRQREEDDRRERMHQERMDILKAFIDAQKK